MNIRVLVVVLAGFCAEPFAQELTAAESRAFAKNALERIEIAEHRFERCIRLRDESCYIREVRAPMAALLNEWPPLKQRSPINGFDSCKQAALDLTGFSGFMKITGQEWTNQKTDQFEQHKSVCVEALQ